MKRWNSTPSRDFDGTDIVDFVVFWGVMKINFLKFRYILREGSQVSLLWQDMVIPLISAEMFRGTPISCR